MKRPTLWIVSACLTLTAVSAGPAAAQEPLTFFKNYFVTGDYVVRGRSLWRQGSKGVATVDLPPIGGADGVTPGADIAAAFLYIQTAEKIRGSGADHVLFGPTPGKGRKFGGADLGPFYAPGSNDPGSGTFLKALNWDQATVPCWTVLFPGGGRRLVTYRADVLRFLPIDPVTKKQSLTTSFRLTVPDAGDRFDDDDEERHERDDLSGPRAIGASLVVVYVDPSRPFKSIVIYDGGFTKRAFATMNQTIEGFYEATVSGARSARMTHIVGDGRPWLSEKVRLGTQLFVNPFGSADGAKWDDWTTSISLPPGASSAAIKVEPNTLLSDCLSWSAIVLSTTVQDTDGDGLLDVWETDPPPIDVRDPSRLQRLPNLAQMGASANRKDIFAEIGFLWAREGTLYNGAPKPAHSHLPSLEALKMVGDAFANAPGGPITMHFDVGDQYQIDPQTGQRSPYIIAATLARGGRNRSETLACLDSNGATVECLTASGQLPIPGQYPAFPGTVGWKTGYRFLRDELLGFDANRKDEFRYVLFGHFLGMPKEPCLNADSTTNLACETTSPDFHVPVTNSGIGDFPGGDYMVTLGAFDDDDKLPIGTTFFQAGTILHEFGHTGWLTHSGALPRAPNCDPPYLSSMNYLYQLRGLLDNDGKPHIDFSRPALQPIPGPNETSLIDGVLGTLAALPYRLGWYAPKATSFLQDRIVNGQLIPGGTAATKHCDGSEITDAEKLVLNQFGGMVRVDAVSTAVAKLDWNADGTSESTGQQDLDFNGIQAPLAAAKDDWSSLRLNQLGGRRNVGGYYTDAAGRKAVGPLSLDVGRGDIGRGDIGRGDIGRGDIGRGDIGRGDIGRGDIGRGDIGRGDIGRGDIGRGDIGRGGGDLDVGFGSEPQTEISLEVAKAVEGDKPTPPAGLQACLTTEGGGCAATGGNIPVRLEWQAPHLGKVVAYQIYRFAFEGEFATPTADRLPTTAIATVIGDCPACAVPTLFFDQETAPGGQFAYFVRASFDDETTSGISNFATVTTPARLTPPPAPVLLFPINNAAVAQNSAAIGCSLLPGPDALRGFGFQIVFDWSDVVAPAGVAGYRISARKVGAALPIVDNVLVTAATYTLTSCNSFVADDGLTGWEWTVHAIDHGQQVSPISTGQFSFAPCRLADGSACRAPAPAIGTGTITDPAGDSGQGNPDLVSATVIVQDVFTTMKVRFAPGTFNANTTVAQFLLDTDQNPATGHPGTNSGCVTDAAQIGSEYFVEFGSTVHGTTAQLQPYLGTCNSFGPGTTTAAGSVTYLADGMDVTFPRSLIANDDGFLNFKVVTFSFIGPGFTGVVDQMTDVGQPAGVVVPFQ